MITLLDNGAGNIRSVKNAIKKLGCEVKTVEHPQEIVDADRLVFPGVGNFGQVMFTMHQRGYIEPLLRRISEDRPLLGICVAFQALFTASEESLGVDGLGIIPGTIKRFDNTVLSVPHMGWNGLMLQKHAPVLNNYHGQKVYFVHSYYAEFTENNRDWVLTTTDYGGRFISSIQRGNLTAFQFHPEKSGKTGLSLIQNFISNDKVRQTIEISSQPEKTALAKRVVACLDVRADDAGNLVVTKGDQYDVREEGTVRDLGNPVEMAKDYYDQGIDEITFLNITGFRDFPMKDQPMLEILKKTSENVFVPLTIGGGIREFTDTNGKHYSALDVAAEYFRSGADKISIGSDAVKTVEDYLARGDRGDGTSAIEQISRAYGAQAVVISVDPRRVYLHSAEETSHAVIKTDRRGPDGQEYCWFQCTIKGGREGRDIDVIQLVTVCEKLGAGEILLNCIDRDGSNSGFDLELINHVAKHVSIPIIASSGAGKAEHFNQVFTQTGVEAALAAGIFHRHEVRVHEVHASMVQDGIITR